MRRLEGRETIRMDHRYRAFVSYNQQDSKEAARLHRRIESFRVPNRLRGFVGRYGPVPDSLAPVFRDRDELAASADIGGRLHDALARSDFLIVLCSPAAARSKWVNAEIETFCALAPGNRERVLAVLVAGEPASGEEATECFPPALRVVPSGPQGLAARYPLAADYRPGKDRRADAELRLFAALLGVEFDVLKQREQERRIGRLRLSLVTALAISGLFAVVAAFAHAQRVRAKDALRQAELAQQRAEAEAAVSNAISDFLRNDLLAQSAPDKQRDRDIKLSAVLDRAAAKIPSRFPDQPLVAGAVRMTLGETFVSLTDYPQAALQYEAARGLFAQALGEDHPKTLDAASALTGVYVMLAKYPEAEGLGTRTLAALRRTSPGAAPTTLRLLSNLATLYQKQGRFKEAEATALELIPQQQQLVGAEHPDTLRTRANLAALYLVQGKLAEAEEQFSQVYEIAKRALGDEHPMALQIGVNLSIVLSNRGKLREAETIQLKIVDINRRVLGPEHQNTLSVMNSLGVTYLRTGRKREACELFERVLAAKEKTLGPDHPDTLKVMNNITVILVEQSRYSDAEVVSRKLLEAQKLRLGLEHPDVFSTQHNLSVILWFQGKLAEAAELQRAVLNTKLRVLGENHRETLESMDLMMLVLSRQQRFDEAVAIGQRAIALSTRALGPAHATTRLLLRDLGRVHFRQLGGQVAERFSREALETSLTAKDATPDFVLSCGIDLARALLAQSRPDEAEAVLRQVMDIAAKGTGVPTWQVAYARTLWGAALSGNGQVDAAELALAQGCRSLLENKNQVPTVDRELIQDAIDRIAQFFEGRNGHDKAREWRAMAGGA